MIEIVIPTIPLAWKAPYVGSHGSFSPRYHTNKIVKDLIAERYTGEIIDVAIVCDMIFYMPIPKSASKKKRLLMIAGILRPEGTPDITNLRKGLEDLLQGIVIKNDSKIVAGNTSKYYGEVPRSVIQIYKL